ncbi:PEPxxWA-CTERM sorting domain-containing protein [Pseudoduganella sp. FT55W]|uniref:PEPxxWA-CTERM sorting domain-containing protein n=1 Tax=Duganella rivi TaxID=2666083 RepID=A0A7X4KC83_9BURK|nr:PEP-CTERM sorting domain-containing protein [Duganella rivi]MYM67717.1 PEPxxWA-CTERM sorting domain-containing protein [Duganella rivi]
MMVKTSLKLAAFAVAAALSTMAGAVETNLTNQYQITSAADAVVGETNQYVFTYTVKNLGQGYAGTHTGLDGLTIYVPDSATFLGATVPDAFVGQNHAPGYWSTGFSTTGLDLSLGNGDTSENMAAVAGYKTFTFWGQYTESVYQLGSTATFTITLGNVSVGQNAVGISSYYGGYGVPSGQSYVNNQYGNYTTFTTTATSAIAAVPEPETYAMMLAGLGMVGLIARRRRRQA